MKRSGGIALIFVMALTGCAATEPAAETEAAEGDALPYAAYVELMNELDGFEGVGGTTLDQLADGACNLIDLDPDQGWLSNLAAFDGSDIAAHEQGSAITYMVAYKCPEYYDLMTEQAQLG